MRKVDDAYTQPKKPLPAGLHSGIPIEVYLAERTKIAYKCIPRIQHKADGIRAMPGGLDHLAINAAANTEEFA
jgi:hypothetical protein